MLHYSSSIKSRLPATAGSEVQSQWFISYYWFNVPFMKLCKRSCWIKSFVIYFPNGFQFLKLLAELLPISIIISKAYRQANGWYCFPKYSWRKRDEVHWGSQDYLENVIMGRRTNFVVGSGWYQTLLLPSGVSVGGRGSFTAWVNFRATAGHKRWLKMRLMFVSLYPELWLLKILNQWSVSNQQE